jgi:hypothetical protein
LEEVLGGLQEEIKYRENFLGTGYIIIWDRQLGQEGTSYFLGGFFVETSFLILSGRSLARDKNVT